MNKDLKNGYVLKQQNTTDLAFSFPMGLGISPLGLFVPWCVLNNLKKYLNCTQKKIRTETKRNSGLKNSKLLKLCILV